MTISKVIQPISVQAYGAGRVHVFCKIEYDGKRLSISGVEGPKRNGDCVGSCGQITESLRRDDALPSAGWTADLVAKFAEVWDRWHLNYMRAGCEHQRGIDATREVEVITYKLTTEAHKMREATIEQAAKAALAGKRFRPTKTARALATMETWYLDIHQPPDSDSPLSGCYEVAKRETKAIGWVTQEEHPDGLLSRPCKECGYRYGSAWLHEDVPEEVLAFLASLPDSPITPAWV